MTDSKMTITEFQQKVLTELATIREHLSTYANSSDSSMKKQKKERKPRDPNAKPNDWIIFTGRVRSVLKDAGLAAGKECQQFASFLKNNHTDAYQMSDKAILDARSDWTAPPPKPKEEKEEVADEETKPKPKRTLSDEQKAKMAAGRKAAAERKKAEKQAETVEDIEDVAAPAPPAAAVAAPPVPVEKKLRPLPFKGKKYLWDPETNGLWKMEADSSKGEWAGVLSKDRKSIDSSASNPDDE